MKILSIETSCDETAISIVEANGDLNSLSFSVLGNAVFSQIETHKQYGGVFPKLAKREHAKNLIPILKIVLEESKLAINTDPLKDINWDEIEAILNREDGLFETFKNYLEYISKPDIDLISVTSGPGLEPALWVGISFATALGKLWNIPVTSANHMEGHIASVLVNKEQNTQVDFPAISLLISGGHTEIVDIPKWGEFKILGATLDDAVGEAFDKVARLLGLPYPGGPEISKLAEIARTNRLQQKAKFPRPMIHSKDYNFSFSGLKTAVLYYIRDNFGGSYENLTEEDKQDIAREFEDSVVEILKYKVKNALDQKNYKTLIIAGGVIANKKIRQEFLQLREKYPDLVVKVPTNELSTDNSIMIACATYLKYLVNPEIVSQNKKIIANGNLKLN